MGWIRACFCGARWIWSGTYCLSNGISSCPRVLTTTIVSSCFLLIHAWSISCTQFLWIYVFFILSADRNHLPSLFLGMEYARAGNHDVALAFLQSSSSRCPSDVAPLNEWGVVLYVSHEYVSSCNPNFYTWLSAILKILCFLFLISLFFFFHVIVRSLCPPLSFFSPFSFFLSPTFTSIFVCSIFSFIQIRAS